MMKSRTITRRVLEWLAGKLPEPRIIYDRMGASPYLSRYYIIGRPKMPDGSSPFAKDGAPKRGVIDAKSPVGVYLHRFHRGDDDVELHNHPWRWAVSLVLAGGYIEERRVPGTGVVYMRTIWPWNLNVIGADDFHRVDLIEDDAWSLFVTGPRFANWGFWNRLTDEFTPWREFITRKRDPKARWEEAS